MTNNLAFFLLFFVLLIGVETPVDQDKEDEEEGHGHLGPEPKQVPAFLVIRGPENANETPDVNNNKENEEYSGDHGQEYCLAVTAEHDPADDEEAGPLHQEPGGEPAVGAGGEDQGASCDHGDTRQEDDDEDQEDSHAGGGDTQWCILWLPGDDPGYLL